MNPWDTLSQYFDTHKHADEVDPGAADNVLIAWPSLFRGIESVQTSGDGLLALDYGCGGGGLVLELLKRGYKAVGCDSSAAMIEIAKKNTENFPFYACDHVDVPKIPEAPFDLITAVMVFQFINNIESCIAHLFDALKPEGVIAFAVFNPEYVAPNHGDTKLFRGFQSPDNPTIGYMVPIENTRIPVFIRTEEEYDAIFIRRGFRRLYSDKPPFTPEFLNKYPSSMDTKKPEYLVIAYQRQ